MCKILTTTNIASSHICKQADDFTFETRTELIQKRVTPLNSIVAVNSAGDREQNSNGDSI